MPSSIDDYIKAARAKKLSYEKIKQSLLNAGWAEDQITKALTNDSADLDVPPPPPSAVPHIGMWTGFLYILFFISLYVLATSISMLFHDMIDRAIPDVKGAYDNFARSESSSFIRGAIASVIVSFPIFATLALVLRKQLVKQPAVSNLRSRKLLIYLTLIGTFLIMLCHVIYIIYTFLDGKVTANAMGHLGITFLIAGSIFGYFISEVRHDRKTQ